MIRDTCPAGHSFEIDYTSAVDNWRYMATTARQTEEDEHRSWKHRHSGCVSAVVVVRSA